MEPTTNSAKKATQAAAPAAKAKGGNDGKTPRALRGAPKPATSWTPAQEAAFQAQQKAREAFVAERTGTLAKVAGLLFKDAQSHGVSAVKDAEGNVLAEAKVFEAGVSQEQLLANLEAHGDEVLTFLSKHFKLQPTLLKH
jgi:hypothetical protein